jgi:hypothetical protein
MPAYGPKRRFAAPQRYVSNWGVQRTCLKHARNDAIDLFRIFLLAE